MNISVKNLPVHVKHDEETGLYVGIVPGLHGAHTQAATFEELQKNLEEVIDLCLKEQST